MWLLWRIAKWKALTQHVESMKEGRIPSSSFCGEPERIISLGCRSNRFAMSKDCLHISCLMLCSHKKARMPGCCYRATNPASFQDEKVTASPELTHFFPCQLANTPIAPLSKNLRHTQFFALPLCAFHQSAGDIQPPFSRSFSGTPLLPSLIRSSNWKRAINQWIIEFVCVVLFHRILLITCANSFFLIT